MPGYMKKVGENKYRLYVSNGFRPDGKPNRKNITVNATSDRAADKKLQEFYLEFCKQLPQVNSKITFEEFSDIWIKRHVELLSANTQKGMLSTFNRRILPYFSKMQLKKINTSHIESFIDEINSHKERLDSRNGELSLASIYDVYKIVRSMLNKAVEWGYISSNPCNAVSKEKRPKKIFNSPDIMEYKQLEEFLKKLFSLKDTATNTKHQLFIYLSLIDGARLGEHVALTWNDIDLEQHKWNISKGVYEKDGVTKVKSTKTEKNRVGYFDDITAELLKRHKAYQNKWLEKNNLTNPNQYVFLKTRTKKAEMPTREMFGHWLSKFLKKNNLKHIGVHGLRRMAATYALSNGVPLTAVKEMLGHTNISTTNIYLRNLHKDRINGVKTMSNVFGSMIHGND